MYKRILGFFLVLVLVLSFMPVTIFADEHQHTFGDNKRGRDMSELPDEYYCPVSFYETPCDSLCGYSKYEWTFAGASNSFVDESGLNPLQIYLRWHKWFESAYSTAANLEKMDATNGGANIPAAGGRNPKGYGDEGKANVTSTGVEVLWVEPFGLSCYGNKGFYWDAPPQLISGRSSSGTSYFNTNSGAVAVVYYIEAPVSGLYYVGSSNSPYDFGTFNYFSSKKWNRKDLIFELDSPYAYSVSLSKGRKCYFWYYFGNFGASVPYKFYLNNLPLFVEPLGDSSITTVNNITITNNNYSQTWNGNIYTDNSTNLTYIYPQYTTINESGDTVTNISNNPIIYNNETKQYYTYDQTTKNYYYIYYGSDSPTPSPTPDPGTGPTPTPGGGSSGGDDGSGSGGSSGSSGSSWWEKLLDKLGSALIDGLLGAISAVLKLIFKLLSTILGWIIWLVSQVLTLFPFLPPGLGALLIGGVVVCFVIGIIKFIRG